MDEKYYGILMHKFAIGELTYIFKSMAFIEGTIIEEDGYKAFYDNNECEYLLANDSDIIGSEEDTVVGYPISESELKKKYDGYTLEEAKQFYIADAFDHVHIGCYVEATNEIKVVPTNLLDYVMKMNGLVNYNGEIEFDDFAPIEEDNNEQTIEINIEGDCIFISLDRFKELLEYDNLEELKKELQDMYDNSKEIFTEFNNMSKVTLEEEIETIYSEILNMNNLIQVKKTISKVKHAYMDELLAVMHNQDEDKDVTENLNEIHSICDPYHNMMKTDDVELIKKELALVKDSTIKKLQALDPTIQENILNRLKNIVVAQSVSFDVQSIKKHFDERIIGQEEAKRDVIAAIYMNKLSNDPANKNNCLLIGPTGSGKTLIAETVAEYFDMPMEIIDTTQLTVPGYVGADLEDFLERLLTKAKGDLKAAEEGIIVFDEIDKKGTNSNGDISGKGVLNTLLPFIGGTTYDIKYNGRMVHFNTSKLTIFATGAFTDAVLDKENGYNGNNIGFGSQVNSKTEDIDYPTLTRDDLVKKANIPAELVGRFAVITQLSGHTLESLKSILTNSDKSALLSEQAKLSNVGINLSWTEGYLDAVAKEAIKLKTGARSLKSTVDKSIKEVRWEVINHLDQYSGIILTEQTVEDNLNCLLVDKEGNTKVFKDMFELEKAKVKVKE